MCKLFWQKVSSYESLNCSTIFIASSIFLSSLIDNFISNHCRLHFLLPDVQITIYESALYQPDITVLYMRIHIHLNWSTIAAKVVFFVSSDLNWQGSAKELQSSFRELDCQPSFFNTLLIFLYTKWTIIVRRFVMMIKLVERPCMVGY